MDYIPQQYGSSANIQPSEFYKWGLEIEDVVDNLEHNLRGEFWDKTVKKWVKKGIILMNDKGINFISTLVRSRLGRHIAMSDLEEEDVRRIALEVCSDVADVLEDKWREFGVELSYLETIVDIVDHIVYITLRRAYHGGERVFIKDIAPEERRVVSDTGGSKPALLPFFRGND